ncbi:sensor histidine kinase [Allonocardiopsis opalescens]|nr:histidine kinase [Allonocardiopsis opalescens]
MGDWPLVSARRFETFVRWSAYLLATAPLFNFLSGTLTTDRLVETRPATVATVFGLELALVAGNMLVGRRNIDALVGRPRRLPARGLAAWTLVLVALVGVLLTLPGAAMGLSVAMAIGSVAAAFVPVLDARRTLLLNAAVLVITAPLLAVEGSALLATGMAVISVALWACWSNVWMLRVLLELQEAHESRAALTLANERLRISRDLHDVFGRTLASISVKSALASELVRRGRDGRAADELGDIQRLADQAGTEVRRVVRGELRPAWEDEVSGARSLLESAGIRCTVAGDPVPEPCAEALAWVVREGVTNVLRHSSATRVTLATATGEDGVLLTVANDGAGAPEAAGDGGGTGLRAMSERIGALGGRITTRRDGDWFMLDATIPLPKGAAA